MASPEETLMENLPSISVIVPFVVPFSTTFAPIMGKPVSSKIVPVIFLPTCWVEETTGVASSPIITEEFVSEA